MPGVRSDNPNQLVGAATHRDLYRFEDPAAERVRLTREARKLSLGFLLIFGLLFGLVGFSANGLWSKDLFVAFDSEHWPADDRVDDPNLFAFVFADATSAPVERVVPWESAAKEAAPAASGSTRVVVVVGRERRALLVAAAAHGGGPPRAVRFSGGDERPVLDGPHHAWEAARLFGVVPIRYFVVGGLVLGVLSLIPPLGRSIYRFWMAAIAHPLSWINTRLILGLFFAVVFVPAGLWLWVRRKLWPVEGDPLQRAPRPEGSSYWHDARRREPTHFRRWF
ncbi:MAG: hypothetical protein D6731_06495 [Planctomycetota bacterium]|nr:MAG: hypothetical protein D6731_06495 [Planctomycetota bacterium]